MYHYVRDLKNSRYPDIKGCDVRLFKEQVLFLKKHYNPVTVEQVFSTIPIALCDAREEGKLKGNILLAGFGVGLSWGATILKCK